MNFQKLYLKYCNAVVFVEVEDRDGNIAGGTAFHIGEGIFFTAKHVVENRQIRSVETLTRGYHKDDKKTVFEETAFHVTKSFRQYDRQRGQLVLGPFCSRYADVAVFTVSGIDAPSIPVGLSSYDYMFDDDEMILSRVLVMGYPRVAFADGPRLMATKAEISTIIDKISPGPPFFIISAMARGGFSGGPCLSKYGECLGLITESLMCENQTTETGFMSVLTVKPMLQLLIDYNLVPQHLEEVVDDAGIFNWRRPEDPSGMHWDSPDSIARSAAKFEPKEEA